MRSWNANWMKMKDLCDFGYFSVYQRKIDTELRELVWNLDSVDELSEMNLRAECIENENFGKIVWDSSKWPKCWGTVSASGAEDVGKEINAEMARGEHMPED